MPASHVHGHSKREGVTEREKEKGGQRGGGGGGGRMRNCERSQQGGWASCGYPNPLKTPISAPKLFCKFSSKKSTSPQ